MTGIHIHLAAWEKHCILWWVECFSVLTVDSMSTRMTLFANARTFSQWKFGWVQHACYVHVPVSTKTADECNVHCFVLLWCSNPCPIFFSKMLFNQRAMTETSTFQQKLRRLETDFLGSILVAWTQLNHSYVLGNSTFSQSAEFDLCSYFRIYFR